MLQRTWMKHIVNQKIVDLSRPKNYKWNVGALLDVQFRLRQVGTLENTWYLVLSSTIENIQLKDELGLIITRALPMVQLQEMSNNSVNLDALKPPITALDGLV
jgi:hypothetical protein